MKTYENPEMDITIFGKKDQILTSIGNGGYNGQEEEDDFENFC